MILKNHKSAFRQRGYKCSKCDIHTMIFGSDAAPSVCLHCGASGTYALMWDHLVKQETTVTDAKGLNLLVDGK